MQNQEQKIVELKCKVCGTVCGEIAFPVDQDIDLVQVENDHIVNCDFHPPLKIEEVLGSL